MLVLRICHTGFASGGLRGAIAACCGRSVLETVILELDGQRYAVSIADVQEIVRAVAVVRLPDAPPVIEGIVNLRGTLVPVLDLRKRFGLPPRPIHLDDHFVIARAGERMVALRGDGPTTLATIDPAVVSDPHTVVPRSRYLEGIAKLAGGMVLIHDVRTFLSHAEAMSLDGALRAQPAR